MEYDVRGYVHKLYNLLECAHVPGIIDYNHLIREHRELNAALLPQDKVEVPDNLEEAIRLHVKHVCEKYNSNITKAAEALECFTEYGEEVFGIDSEIYDSLVIADYL